MFHFASNFFDSILCARFMHVVVYSYVSLNGGVFIYFHFSVITNSDVADNCDNTCGINMYVFILGV